MKCIFYKHLLVTLESATFEGIFKALDQLFSEDGHLKYPSLVGLGSDGVIVMLGSRNSVLTQFKAQQTSVVSFHCNCHITALIANHACKEMLDFLDDLA